MSESIARLLKYIEGNIGPCTSHVPHFVWFQSPIVKLWMNEELQITKIVLSVEQRVFIVKRYYETHSLKRVHNDYL